MNCKVAHKRQVLVEQSSSDSGNYYKYLKALYTLFLQKAKEQGRDYATDVSLKEKMSAVANCNVNAYISPTVVLQYQNELKKMKYISVRKVHNEWRIYIIDELDF